MPTHRARRTARARGRAARAGSEARASARRSPGGCPSRSRRVRSPQPAIRSTRSHHRWSYWPRHPRRPRVAGTIAPASFPRPSPLPPFRDRLFAHDWWARPRSAIGRDELNERIDDLLDEVVDCLGLLLRQAQAILTASSVLVQLFDVGLKLSRRAQLLQDDAQTVLRFHFHAGLGTEDTGE